MKNLKQLLNEWAQETTCLHKVSEQERKQFQTELLGMYMDLRDLCDAHGLKMMMCGGSCLGAIRHKGFIPWDDDLDVMLPRKDYNVLLKLLRNGQLSDKYEYRYPDGRMECSSSFLKLYKKNTIVKEFDTLGIAVPSSLFLDVFPVEYAPSNQIHLKVKGIIANCLRYIGNCVCDYKRNNEFMIQAMNDKPELSQFMKSRFIIGRLFSFVSNKRWKYWFDRWVADEQVKPLMTIPTGRGLYEGELLDANIFSTPLKVPFEDTFAYIPEKYEDYLSNLYKDYMAIPPIEKRESHFVIELKL